ncbi:ParB/RepB/Spo0J family partition protein [Arthrobacter sp. AL08]|uniref:ParB/RepB/Spo0J family partition protein n=1 Tax=Micrococcaceae TaxID=1268 RepID=UPI001CFF8FE1|nr:MULTISPECIES: ParB/RepB/Spo0J family partition protein [Micrococcaceae]MCB5282984.1 putative chromosome-partitioning protein ParB [Arthrobacter sp. ES1]MDI3242061.1 ParB/RepB/Spo0J family partition protein [Arthrobacter sp. AL05]MDI3277999.1 ParB/RepB/Spo0J family partition protein [Arthrobacter sp. AL08]MDJ0352513.1 ParB/RepB/Spo0J family partition protein [Pseudarthrobacter sp. PH31-O2]WGZ79391.1 ParB/RepB/Spo0J family partition protein [Arthrobacter sp. EM1]
MSDKRRGLGRGLGALIPSSAAASGSGSAPSRPVDLFFPEGRKRTPDAGAAAGELVPAEDMVAAPAETSSPAAANIDGSAHTSSKPASETRKAPVRKAPDAETGSQRQGQDVELVEVPGVRFAEIPVTDIHPNRKQPRSVFDEDDMAELVHSVREIGVLQPIVVRTSTEIGGEPYELVMGERRWRAVQAAGLETIPAIVRDTTDDDLLRDALLENLHRSQLNPLEEAAAYQQLLEDFGTTHEQLADRIGRSRPQVSNTLRLLKLPPLVQRRVAAGVISAGHARALLALPDAPAMERMAQKIVAEGMSVRATEEAVTLYQNPTATPKNNIPRPGARHERLDYLASSLSDRLDTNVKISLGARKGRVSIEFASVEDLNRIMDVLTPGAAG